MSVKNCITVVVISINTLLSFDPDSSVKIWYSLSDHLIKVLLVASDEETEGSLGDLNALRRMYKLIGFIFSKNIWKRSIWFLLIASSDFFHFQALKNLLKCSLLPTLTLFFAVKQFQLGNHYSNNYDYHCYNYQKQFQSFSIIFDISLLFKKEIKSIPVAIKKKKNLS